MRRTIILFFIALVVVLVAAFVAFILVPSENGGNNGGGQQNGGLFGSLFPFNFGGGNGIENGGSNGGEPIVDNRPIPVLRQISANPTSGGYFYANEEGNLFVRYIERQTGHVYEVPTEERSATRLSNTTVPAIHEVLFANANNFIIRYLNDGEGVENFFVTLEDGIEDQSLQGDFLDSWERGSVNQSGENLLVVYETSSGSSVVLSDVNGEDGRTVLSSPIRSWIPLQSNAGSYIYTAPAPSTPGFLYRISNGILTKVAGDISGMLALVSASGRYALVSGGEREQALYLYDTQTGEQYESPISTLATKCVFTSEDAVQIVCGVPQEFSGTELPNSWLLGRVSFNDDIWLIEPVEGTATLLSLPQEDAGQNLDVWQPTTDAEGNYFGFINKKDLSYWALRLKEPTTPEEETGE